MNGSLVLSTFPGIGLLDKAFEEEGFCVVRGPDVLWGGDVRAFHPPSGVFDGVIGGPPCQAFSPLRHFTEYWGYTSKHGNLIPEFERVVREAAPEWFLMENVPDAPEPRIEGYSIQHVPLNNRWVGGVQNRIRRISFGTKNDPYIWKGSFKAEISADAVALESVEYAAAVTSSDGGRKKVRMPRYTVEQMVALQELPDGFLEHAPFTVEGKKTVLANGVPLPMGRAIARAVKRAVTA